ILTRGRGESPARGERPYSHFMRAGLSALRGMWILAAAMALVAFASPAFTLTWAPRAESLGAPVWAVGVMGSALFAAVGLSQYLGGELSRRLGEKRTAVLGAVVQASSMGLAALAPDPPSFALAALPFEVGLGIRSPATSAWVARAAPSEERATVISLVRTVALSFGALGMGAVGVAADWLGVEWALALGACAMAGAAVALSRAREVTPSRPS
ncbi:MAG: hypothetical protein DRO06_02815, partial [Thermoproteota archaeon]